MKYRPHIDGLRAVAVLSVIFFHYDIKALTGGFVGVDMFFVISGFLISSIIYKELQETSQFSMSRFYMRRLKRLAPSLIVTTLIVYVTAITLFTSQQLAALGAEIVTGLFSVSNFLFWSQSGYFDVATEQKPLLHLWSLSVEEQFYIVWPLMLLLSYRFYRGKGVAIVSSLVFVVSLTASVLLTQNDLHWFTNQLAGLFYLTPFRAFEFMIGAFGIVLVNKMPSSRMVHELAFIAGIIGVIFSINQYNASTLFPYYTALLPCISVLLLIVSERSKLSILLFENRLMVSIGLISYTLYLVHWPVIVFTKHLTFGELSNKNIAMAFAVTVIVSVLIYRYVETPLRHLGKTANEKNNSNKNFIYGCLVAVLITSGLGVSLIITNGYQNLKDELYADAFISEGKSNRYSLIKSACRIESLNTPQCYTERQTQVLVFGNSHEPDGYNIVRRMTQDNESVNLVLFGGTNNCDMKIGDESSLISSDSKRNRCDIRAKALSNLEFVKSLDVLVYSSNRPFAPNKKGSWELFSNIKKINPELKLVVLGTYFNTELECSELANRVGNADACKELIHLSYTGAKEQASPQAEDLTAGIDYQYLSKFDALCTLRNGKYTDCVTEGYNEPMFYDQHHLSLGFSKLVGERYAITYFEELKTLGLLLPTAR
jgi:peptidoglycan/LPS O-acetylase OafA/YrhL